VALITAAPLPIAVTAPVPDTVAADGFDDDQVATLVTSCVLPVERVAVAVNCDVAPTAGTAPVTLTDDTELAAVDEFPHAPARHANPRMMINANVDRVFIHAP
jgi:sulfur carrier protein ThiS